MDLHPSDLSRVELSLSEIAIPDSRPHTEPLAIENKDKDKQQDGKSKDVDSNEDVLHAHIGDPRCSSETEYGR